MSDEFINSENQEENLEPQVKETEKKEEMLDAQPESSADGEGGGDDAQRRGLRQKRDLAMKGEIPARVPRFKKKVCRFCHDKSLPIDYKRADILEGLITERGKILPRRITGTCAKHQRFVAKEIKRARIIALLPFVEK